MVEYLIKRDDAFAAIIEAFPKLNPFVLDKALEKAQAVDSYWKPYPEKPKRHEIPVGKYLVQTKDGEMHVGELTAFGWMFGHYVQGIVAYRQLPAPYKGVE